MKTLYLIRHAKSDWSQDVPDLERGLNQRGQDAAPLMGRRLKERNAKIDYIISSYANRAVMTAELIADAIVYPKDHIDIERDIYQADVKGLLEVINDIDNQYDHVILIGHNPTMTAAANELGDEAISHMPTCAICALGFSVDDWRAVTRGMGTCLFFDYPKRAY